MMTHHAREFVLEFAAETAELGVEVLEARVIRAMSPDDAAREAAFSGWPQGARVCRIADPDGRELASVARILIA
jgi:hypothetical protein